MTTLAELHHQPCYVRGRVSLAWFQMKLATRRQTVCVAIFGNRHLIQTQDRPQCHQPFTAPAVMPLTMKRFAVSANRITGAMTNTA